MGRTKIFLVRAHLPPPKGDTLIIGGDCVTIQKAPERLKPFVSKLTFVKPPTLRRPPTPVVAPRAAQRPAPAPRVARPATAWSQDTKYITRGDLDSILDAKLDLRFEKLQKMLGAQMLKIHTPTVDVADLADSEGSDGDISDMDMDNAPDTGLQAENDVDSIQPRAAKKSKTVGGI